MSRSCENRCSDREVALRGCWIPCRVELCRLVCTGEPRMVRRRADITRQLDATTEAALVGFDLEVNMVKVPGDVLPVTVSRLLRWRYSFENECGARRNAWSGRDWCHKAPQGLQTKTSMLLGGIGVRRNRVGCTEG